MGLAASQGRYLSLTARNSDLIYEAQQISQQRLALANKTQEVSTEYSEAMNNRIMQATVIINGEQVTQQLTYDLLTNPDSLSGLNMRLVDLDGNVVVPGEYIQMTKQEADKEPVTSRIYSAEDFISSYLRTDADKAAIEGFKNSLPDLVSYYNSTYSSTSSTTAELMSKSNAYNGLVKSERDEEGNISTTEKLLIDSNCLDPQYLHKMLTTGQWIIQKNDVDGYKDFMWQGSSKVSEVYDTSDDAAAEAKYEADMLELQKMDKILELRLEEIQTEQGAVEKEMEAIKQVIDKNIETTFNTFN